MQTRTADRLQPWRLAALWFGIQAVWGAVLGLSLQGRTAQLGGHDVLMVFAQISAVGALAAAVVQLLVGPFSDARRRHGDRRIAFYVVGAIGASLATMWFYRAGNIAQLAASFVALQIFMNAAIGPYQAIVPDFVPTERIGAASGWMAAMQSAGNALGAIAASLILSAAWLGIALAVVLLASCALTVVHAASLRPKPFESAPGLVVTRPLVDLFASRAFVYLGFYTMLDYLFFYVSHALPSGFALSATTASGICILLFTLLGTAGAALAARPADRLDERLVVCIGGGVVALAVIALSAVVALPMIPIAIAVAGIGWGIFLCADWAFACRTLPTGALATTMAGWNLAVIGPQMLAPIVTTAVLRGVGSLTSPVASRIALGLAGLEIVIGVAWIWRLPPTGKGDKERIH